MKIPDNPLDLPVLFKGLKIEELTVLDLGSGRLDSPLSVHMRELKFKELTLVEGWIRSYRDLFYLKERKMLAAQESRVLLIDAWQMIRHEPDLSYDVVTLLDIVEHFSKVPATEVLNKAKQVARKRVLVWIPIGDCPQENLEGNPLQTHLSVWDASELEELGFNVRVYDKYHKHFTPNVSAAWAVWDRQVSKDSSGTPLYGQNYHATEEEAEELRKKHEEGILTADDILTATEEELDEWGKPYENPGREA